MQVDVQRSTTASACLSNVAEQCDRGLSVSIHKGVAPPGKRVGAFDVQEVMKAIKRGQDFCSHPYARQAFRDAGGEVIFQANDLLFKARLLIELDLPSRFLHLSPLKLQIEKAGSFSVFRSTGSR
jgi:hypothetical protein